MNQRYKGGATKKEMKKKKIKKAKNREIQPQWYR